MMKIKLTQFYKTEGDRMKLAVLDFIFEVIHCVILDI